MVGVVLREQVPDDEAALAALAAASPDGGLVAFSPVLHVPERAAAAGQHEESLGVVAEDAAGAVVGAARVAFGRCRVAGEIRPFALLGGLAVHPRARHQGVGRALARRRLELAEDRCGTGVVALANIQQGNAASLANARTWADTTVGRLLVSPAPMRRRPPRARPDLLVREAVDADLAEVAAGLAAFTAGVELARVSTVESLRSWLAVRPDGRAVNHVVVATDRAGRLLAGLGLREEGRLRSLTIQRMPAAFRAVNAVLAVVPPSGEMRNLVVDKVWFAPGRGDAARFLWQTVRWDWRDRGTSLVSTYDPRGPLRQVLRTPPWIPTTSMTVAVRSPVPVDGSRLLDPPL